MRFQKWKPKMMSLLYIEIKLSCEMHISFSYSNEFDFRLNFDTSTSSLTKNQFHFWWFGQFIVHFVFFFCILIFLWWIQWKICNTIQQYSAMTFQYLGLLSKFVYILILFWTFAYAYTQNCLHSCCWFFILFFSGLLFSTVSRLKQKQVCDVIRDLNFLSWIS